MIDHLNTKIVQIQILFKSEPLKTGGTFFLSFMLAFFCSSIIDSLLKDTTFPHEPISIIAGLGVGYLALTLLIRDQLRKKG